MGLCVCALRCGGGRAVGFRLLFFEPAGYALARLPGGWEYGRCGRQMAAGRPRRQRCPIPVATSVGVRDPNIVQAHRASEARLMSLDYSAH